MLSSLERYFEFRQLGTNWRTEVLAGVTTFLTMAYIVLVNPAILATAGVPIHAATAATCLSAAFGSLLMGIVARYPIAVAPGMGLNAYFTYTVCLKMHSVADCARCGIHLRPAFPRTHRGRHPPDDSAFHPARTLRRSR